MTSPDPFLRPSEIFDFDDPSIRRLAASLAEAGGGTPAVAERCFHWVRDRVALLRPTNGGPVAWRASDVLRAGIGVCYAKSHLLVALLRANRIPAGLAYQRLLFDGAEGGFALHGLVTVNLPGFGWLRIDPRGNTDGIDAQFRPPRECLAFRPEQPGEADIPGRWADPLPEVIAAFATAGDWRDLLAHLPDRTDSA